jgi:DNA-binding phage protein
MTMALTKEFKETVRARVLKDPEFRAALLKEAVDTLLAGDVETGKAILRDYINATIGFEHLAAAVGVPAKSLIRMFGPSGNPQARNLFAVIQKLQTKTGVSLRVAANKISARRLAAA